MEKLCQCSNQIAESVPFKISNNNWQNKREESESKITALRECHILTIPGRTILKRYMEYTGVFIAQNPQYVSMVWCLIK
jgi:hypothetical protein